MRRLRSRSLSRDLPGTSDASVATKPSSTRSPSLPSSAGSTVIEPTIATSTTIIVPRPSEVKIFEPENIIPAAAVMTVRPETSTARPEVAAARCSAVSGSAP